MLKKFLPLILVTLTLLSRMITPVGAIPENPDPGLTMPVETISEDGGYSFLQTEDADRYLALQDGGLSLIIYWTNFFIGFVGALVLIYIIYAGWRDMTALGEIDKAKSSGQMIWRIVLGLFIIFAAYALVNTIAEYFTGTGGEEILGRS